jgi:fatty-acyl-CoA synthase
MNFEIDWLKRWNDFGPQRIALRDSKHDIDISYRELYRLSIAVASELKNLGVEKGDRVAVLATNHWFYVALLFGIQRAGGICLPLNYRLAPKELDYILHDARPKVLISETDFIANVPKNSAEKILSWNSFLEQVLALRDCKSIEFITESDDACMLLYTSGTTGNPKGALITHQMLFWNSINTTLRLNVSENDVHLAFMPFFHTGGWNVLLTPFLHRGAKSIVLDKFDPEEVLTLVAKEKVTILFGVPTMLDRMAQSAIFEKTQINSVRFAVVGGEPMPLPLIRKWQTKGIAIRQGYGLTEFGPNVFSLNEQDSERKIGSIGFPNFYIETKVVDASGSAVATNTVGELWLKGPVATPGYWQNPTATKDLFEGEWLKTGDLVRRDEDGYFYVEGRKKEMFISGGENIYPAEIEQALRSHPSILEAAVIGIPDVKWGEVGAAFVVTKTDLTESEVLEHCRAHLARFKVPKSVIFLNTLPKSDSGKILKRKLTSELTLL